MSKSVLSKKLNFFLAIIPFFALFNLIVDFPVNFPEENRLQYTTGIFEIQKDTESTNYVLLTRANNSSGYQEFSCSYSPFSNGRASSCGDLKFLAPYVNNEVTVGWYMVDEFWGFTNDIPQLVTIKMNNIVEHSYADTAKHVKTVQNDTIYLLLPGLFLLCCFFYWQSMRED